MAMAVVGKERSGVGSANIEEVWGGVGSVSGMMG
jgi:hypothetical protein